jgi:hypothetical protein
LPVNAVDHTVLMSLPPQKFIFLTRQKLFVVTKKVLQNLHCLDLYDVDWLYCVQTHTKR